MKTETREALMERLRREDAAFAEDGLNLSKAEIRLLVTLFSIGALFALVCISIGIAVSRWLFL
ncbi:hypothetical protein ACIP1X_13970 [Pseudomonas sp. NPDC088885]|uniref:hypothetical protein n=1 Tax=Pseudomonas sp. NPDC088885 TaxID=3364457 RepID=UPI0038177251